MVNKQLRSLCYLLFKFFTEANGGNKVLHRLAVWRSFTRSNRVAKLYADFVFLLPPSVRRLVFPVTRHLSRVTHICGVVFHCKKPASS